MNTMQLQIDLRWICAALLLVIIAMLALWQPWAGDARTIKVTGEATVERDTDQFTFNPMYQGRGATAEAATAGAARQGNAAVAKLKELGVPGDRIKTDSNNFGQAKPAVDMVLPRPRESDGYTSTYSISFSVTDKSLVQKVTDYLSTSGATGSVTPMASLSDDALKKVKLDAREEAVADARTKAEATAKGLGAKLGSVRSVTESRGGGVMPFPEGRPAVMDSSAAKATPEALTGKQKVTLALEVEFTLR